MRAGHVGWVSLNVNSSVSAWLQSSARVAGRRLDLRVVVSDARSSRTTIDAFDVFHAPNCSVAQLQPSRPGTLQLSAPRHFQSLILHYDTVP